MVAAPMSDIAELQSDDFQMVDRIGYDVAPVRGGADEAAPITLVDGAALARMPTYEHSGSRCQRSAAATGE
jgi:hypothetical protein